MAPRSLIYCPQAHPPSFFLSLVPVPSASHQDVPVFFELLPLASEYYESQILSTLAALILYISGAVPGRNLTRAQQKDSGRGYSVFQRLVLVQPRFILGDKRHQTAHHEHHKASIMIHFCAVFGCGNRSNRDISKSFYRFPKVKLNQGQVKAKLASDRRKLWIARLNRKDINTDSEHNRVCSDHFIAGK